ncbi:MULTISPECIES: hypothetical protein [Myxococcus]|uniref:hypothetical protein n=1 Tax=Myxococcus TaxID=32 RepID=UPI0013D1CC1B|nr:MULTISPECIES: hypothetical protein [Myxococcus]NVJ21605.1 hypothetical protein [Myxococcus sp. AM011]
MKLISKSSFAGVLALVLAPLSASALPLDCDIACEEFESCSLKCAVPWTSRVITCGMWADLYHSGTTCVPTLTAEDIEEELMSSEDVDASSACSEQDDSAR